MEGCQLLTFRVLLINKFYEEIERDSARILKIVYKIVNNGFKLNGMGFI